MASDAFVGEIFMFAGNFAMNGTAPCNGQLLPISQHTALFSLLGTTYGGDGRTTFALPNLQGSSPMHPDGNNYPLGTAGGTQTVTLLANEIPLHTHALEVAMPTAAAATTATAINTLPAIAATAPLYTTTAGSGFMTPVTSTLDATSGVSGGSQPHNNMQPYLPVTFVIALQGEFPPRP